MARFDYLRAGLVYDVRAPGDLPTVERIRLEWDTFWSSWFAEEIEKGTVPMRVEKTLIKGGATMLIFECWGSAADMLLKHSFWYYWNASRLKLLRLDYRQSVATDVDLDRMFYAVDAKNGSNVHTFNSRVRTKHGDRDAGGVGFSIGSHKSDRRLVVYQRGHENAAIEVQMRTRALTPAVEWVKAQDCRELSTTVSSLYSGLSDAAELIAQSFVEKHTRHSIGQLAQGQIEYSHEDHERILGEIEKRYRALSPMAQQAFVMVTQAEEEETTAITRFNLGA